MEQAEGRELRAEGVPQGWQRVKLEKICDAIVSGATPLRLEGARYFSICGIPWVKTTDLTNTYIQATEEKITPVALKETSCKVLPSGTVLVAMYGGFNQIGRTGILTESSAINQALSALLLKETSLPEFVNFWLIAKRKDWKKFAASSRKDPNITRTDVAQFPILLPPLPEQRKIAAILGTWDDGLATLAALIAAKREQKRGLAQLLLTGQKRLAGFEGEWEQTTWGDILSESRISATDELGKRLTVALHLQGVSIREERDNSQVGKTNYFARKAGQFIYGKQNLFRGALGLVPPELDGYLSSQDLPAFDVAPHADPRFVYEYFARPHFYESLERISSGTGSKRVQPKKLYALTLQLPPLPEQRAIADVLSTLDAEITALEGLRAGLQEQKRGLMDELLTGRTRVRV